MTLNFDQLREAFAQQETAINVDCSFGLLRMLRVSPEQLLRLSGLSKTAAAAAEESGDEFRERMLFLRELIAASAVDGSGKRMLDNEQGRELIAQFGALDMTKLSSAAMRVNGLDDAGAEAERDDAKKK